MAPRIIYQADGWTITQDPLSNRNYNLVRFYRSNARRIPLDQIAEWDPNAQDWTWWLWVPRWPTVPRVLLDKIVAHMSSEERAF